MAAAKGIKGTAKKAAPAPDPVESVRLDVDDLTIGDLEDFEDVVGEPLMGFVGNTGKAMSAKVMKALVWITRRRDDEGFSLEDAAAVKVSALDWAGDEEDGDEGSSDPS